MFGRGWYRDVVGERAKDGLVHLLWGQSENADGHQARVIGSAVAVCLV